MIELAKEIGVTNQYLSDVMKGRREPGPKVLHFLGLQKAFVPKKELSETSKA